MQETFIVSVQTEDGRCLILEKIIGSSAYSLYILSQLFSLLASVSEASEKYQISLGHGIGPSVSDSLSPTQS